MKLILFANTDWYLFNFRRSLATALKDLGHDVLLVSPPGPYGPRLEQLGFRWIPAPMQRRSLNPLRELAFLLWLRRLIVKEKIDVIHGFTVKCAVYGSIAGRLGSVPARVAAVTGMGYVFTSSSAKARALQPLVRLLMKWALGGTGFRLILQNADDQTLFLESRLVQPSAVRLIPGSGVDCERFSPRPRSPSAQLGQPLRVLLPARLLWDKGVGEYVAAARELRRAGENIEFLIAGEPDPGNPASVPREAVSGWVREGVIIWLGHVHEMAELFSRVDVVVLPSYREGLPKGLIEAAASGLPLVTTDVPGCRDVVTHGIDGLLVPATDGHALANAILELHRDPLLRKRLGTAAREKALRQFDERIVIARTLGVYEELVPPRARDALPSSSLDGV